ncbi:hypothetical protein [Caldimonas tepidiphila]|uniref:hypothetical protein n=1 Tax=Caldimonas tepidiphila TaxID=2315841 RepID=UPI001300430C|nr:hypothetical protein [Caldimonas tepidiphila]
MKWSVDSAAQSRPTKIGGVLAAVLGLLGPGSALAATPSSWDAQGVASHVLTVAPRQTGQFCLPLRTSQQVVWAFVAPAPLDFDLRGRDGGPVLPSARRDAVREAQGLLEVGGAREHCWIWSNRGEQPVQVALRLRRR